MTKPTRGRPKKGGRTEAQKTYNNKRVRLTSALYCAAEQAAELQGVVDFLNAKYKDTVAQTEPTALCRQGVLAAITEHALQLGYKPGK